MSLVSYSSAKQFIYHLPSEASFKTYLSLLLAYYVEYGMHEYVDKYTNAH